MPNWVRNNLKIVGDVDNMKKFYTKSISWNENTPIWKLSNTLPMPTDLENTIFPSSSSRDYINESEVNEALEKVKNGFIVRVPELIPCKNNTTEKCQELFSLYGADNWYDWRREHWGVKWDCSSDDELCNGVYTLTDTCFEVDFRSANCPPHKWLLNMVALFPQLKFKLYYAQFALDLTGVIYTDENGQLVNVEGYFYFGDENGKVITESENGWIYQNGMPVEKATQAYFYSSVEDFTVWFENDGH